MRMKIILQLYVTVFVMVYFSGCALIRHSTIDVELRKELVAMSKADQDVRNKLIAAGMDRPDKALVARMAEIDSVNTVQIKRIIQEYGWPGKSLVGKEGASAVFLLVQHADRDPIFQKQALPLLRAAYEAGEASGQNLALLTDRVLVSEGKKQLYGTQVGVRNGILTVQPVEDEPNFDKRRKKMGLPSMDKYIKLLKKVYGLK